MKNRVFFQLAILGPVKKGIKLMVLLVLVGCGKDKTETSQPRENFNANASARPELNVFETPGFWEQANKVITPDGKQPLRR